MPALAQLNSVSEFVGDGYLVEVLDDADARDLILHVYFVRFTGN